MEEIEPRKRKAGRPRRGEAKPDMRQSLIDAAIEIIRAKGQAVAAKRSDRDASEGCVLAKYENGFADLANEIPNTIDTRFATASAGKAFVAVGILRLIEAGRLSLDDTIGNLLDFDLHGNDPGVTVRQLLNHTSGVPDYFDESVMEDYEELWVDFPNYKIRRNSDLLPLFIEKPMMYPKGERFQYNNSGYVMLALISAGKLPC